MEFIRWCSILDRQNKRYLDKKLAPFGLNSSQHMYLIRVCREPGITQDSLFSRFYIHPSNITRALAALEQGASSVRSSIHRIGVPAASIPRSGGGRSTSRSWISATVGRPW